MKNYGGTVDLQESGSGYLFGCPVSRLTKLALESICSFSLGDEYDFPARSTGKSTVELMRRKTCIDIGAHNIEARFPSIWHVLAVIVGRCRNATINV